MKSIINNTYHIKNLNIDAFKVWQEVLKAKNKIAKVVKKIDTKQLVKRLVQFWRTYKTAILAACTGLVLFGIGLVIFLVI